MLVTLILVLAFLYVINNCIILSEGYENLYTLTPGDIRDGDYLLKGTFPISNNPVSTKQYSNQWNLYPVFSIPSFRQMTNNLKYFHNPSIARDSPEDFLDTFYKNKSSKSNIVEYGHVKPIVNYKHPRVGYWNSSVDMLY